MYSSLSVFVVIYFISAAIARNSPPPLYCGVGFDCLVGGQMVRHTMCSFADEKPNARICRNQKSNLSMEEQEWILGAHNGMRNLAADGSVPGAPVGWPTAANMRQVTWDHELAMYAEAWAFQCRGGMDDCRQSPEYADRVCQNEDGPRHARNRPDYKDSIKSWFRQMNDARKTLVGSFSFQETNRKFFTMMWATVHKIGCALVEFDVDGEDTEDCRTIESGQCVDYYRHKGIRLVCNYAPAKMRAKSKVWEKGPPCSKCPAGTACKTDSTYPNLCAVSYDANQEKPIVLYLSAASQKSQVRIILLLAVGLGVDASP